jgi:hypothetical protein
MLRENFISGGHTKKESTDAHKGGGLTCSTCEAVITRRGGKGLSQSTVSNCQLDNQEELSLNVYV